MKPDGTGVIKFTNDAARGGEHDDEAPAWSRDGRMIALSLDC